MNNEVKPNTTQNIGFKHEDLSDTLKAVQLLGSAPHASQKIEDWERQLGSTQSGSTWLSIFQTRPEVFYVHTVSDGTYVVLLGRYYNRNEPLDQERIAAAVDIVNKTSTNAFTREQIAIADRQAKTAQAMKNISSRQVWLVPLTSSCR